MESNFKETKYKYDKIRNQEGKQKNKNRAEIGPKLGPKLGPKIGLKIHTHQMKQSQEPHME